LIAFEHHSDYIRVFRLRSSIPIAFEIPIAQDIISKVTRLVPREIIIWLAVCLLIYLPANLPANLFANLLANLLACLPVNLPGSSSTMAT
jgi:hypothetical protein